jgi:intracellular protein transport protein USO1
MELQKLVAFEGTFDRIFQLIQQEGGLKQGGIIIQDCLDLLANLVRQNSSNQSLFRESGCVSKLSAVLHASYEKATGSEDGDDFPNPQMIKNLWGFLAVIRLFLVSGSVGTNINQKTFEKHGLLQAILDLAFRPSTDPAIRSEVRKH